MWKIYFCSISYLFYTYGTNIYNQNRFEWFCDKKNQHTLHVHKCYDIYFLAHLAKSHVSFCHHLASVVRPLYVVNFNLLLRNHRANCNQTLVEWYLYGPLPKLCPLIPTSNQDGRQAKNRKKGGMKF